MLLVSVERVSELRITVAVAQLLAVFLADASEARYGYELMQVTGFPSGKLYPIMGRLTRAGWVTREREDIDPAEKGRPARCLYRLTNQGTGAAREALAELHQTTNLAPKLSLRPWPAGGRA
jgi:PadR family transcriptional regulator, regulatory protein PadR